MNVELQQLCDIDLLLVDELASSEINAEEVVAMVDKREQLLQIVLQKVNTDSRMKQSPLWLDAINRTKFIVEQMQDESSKLAQQLQKFRHGNRSVQQYKKFL